MQLNYVTHSYELLCVYYKKPDALPPPPLFFLFIFICTVAGELSTYTYLWSEMFNKILTSATIGDVEGNGSRDN